MACDFKNATQAQKDAAYNNSGNLKTKKDGSGGGDDSKSTPGEIHAAVEDENGSKISKSSGDKPSYEELLEFQQLVQGFININVAK